MMLVHEEFTSRKLALVFDNGKRVELTKEESKEFERWYVNKQKEKQE